MKLVKISRTNLDLYDLSSGVDVTTVVSGQSATTTSYTLTATSVSIPIHLTQNNSNIGFTEDVEKFNEPISPPYTDLTNNVLSKKLVDLGVTGTSEFSFMTGGTDSNGPEPVLSDYYFSGAQNLTGLTDSKLSSVTSYNPNNPYVIGLNVNPDGIPMLATSVTSASGETGYTIGNITYVSSFDTFSYVLTPYNIEVESNVTEFNVDANSVDLGWNDDNISLSGSAHVEHNLGFVFPTETKSLIFIERGVLSPFEYHARLGEVENLNHLEFYGNKFYNIIKQ